MKSEWWPANTAFKKVLAMKDAAPASRVEAYLGIARMLDVPVAHAVAGYLTFLGDDPMDDRLGVLYSDWIHSTEKGSYLIACSIYAAMTGFSPVGLAHPGIADDDARALQEAA